MSDIIERPKIEFSGRWKDDDAIAPVRHVDPKTVQSQPPPDEEPRGKRLSAIGHQRFTRNT